MSRELYKEAVDASKLLKKAAIENAKNVLVEAIAPQLERKVSEQLGEDLALEMPSMYEVEDEEAPMDVPVDDVEDEEEVDEMMACEGKDEEGEDEEEEDSMEETVNITSEDLQAALAEVLNADLSEAQVTKSFGDVEDATLPASGGKGGKGIADEKSGESQWIDEEPPAAEDWTVKEAAYRKVIKKLQRENTDLSKACNHLKRNIQEVNLFNAKLLHTNKLLQSAHLNERQRIAVIESVDRAQNLREVELVYKSLSESFKIAGVLKESSNKGSKTAKSSRYTSAPSTLLKEQVEREENAESNRWAQLAGLTK